MSAERPFQGAWRDAAEIKKYTEGYTFLRYAAQLGEEMNLLALCFKLIN
jgi:hypothetical protein